MAVTVSSIVSNRESTGQNPLEQKFEWKLRESLFITNWLFRPKETSMKRPAAHETSKGYVHRVKRGFTRNGQGGWRQHHIKLMCCSTEAKTRHSASPLRSLQRFKHEHHPVLTASSFSIIQQRRRPARPSLCCPEFQRENDVNTFPLQYPNALKRTTFSLDSGPRNTDI